MNLKPTRVLSVLLIVILVGACSNIYKKDIDEGIIEYSCEAIDNKENSSIKTLSIIFYLFWQYLTF